MKRLSIVLPVFNEVETLPLLCERLGLVMRRIRAERGLEVEVVLVDDGSTDGSTNLLALWAEEESDVRAVILSRNFGHQAALTAGMDAATGDAVVTMDADLQDPPEVIPRLLDKAREGYDLVYARRTERKGESVFKRGTAWLFYRLMRRLIHPDLPEDVGDFRLVAGPALRALRSLREHHRFLRGLSAWIGFRSVEVPYERPARAAGRTKFSTARMVRLAWDAAISFSTLPLRLVAVWGTFISLFGFAYLGYTVYRYFVYKDTVPGWATLTVLVCLTGGSILVSLGIIGSYIGKIFEETKARPLYIIESAAGRGAEKPDERIRPGEGDAVPRRVGLELQA
jgi:glycosyltransferase involved in cell wall biosynthesis